MPLLLKLIHLDPDFQSRGCFSLQLKSVFISLQHSHRLIWINLMSSLAIMSEITASLAIGLLLLTREMEGRLAKVFLCNHCFIYFVTALNHNRLNNWKLMLYNFSWYLGKTLSSSHDWQNKHLLSNSASAPPGGRCSAREGTQESERTVVQFVKYKV